MDRRDFDALLSVMETGKVVRCKARMFSERDLNLKVYGACNVLERMPPELLSRFLVVRFTEYTRDEFIKVSVNVLQVREGLKPEEAMLVTDLLSDHTRDVRDAVKLARLYMAGGDPERLASLFFHRSNQKTLL